jgi:hypothetical protein
MPNFLSIFSVVFLAGAEMAFAVQVWRSYLWKGTMLNPSTRLKRLILRRLLISYTVQKCRLLQEATWQKRVLKQQGPFWLRKK